MNNFFEYSDNLEKAVALLYENDNKGNSDERYVDSYNVLINRYPIVHGTRCDKRPMAE